MEARTNQAALLVGLVGIGLGLFLVQSCGSSPGCQKDADCKGERVCRNGECVDDANPPPDGGQSTDSGTVNDGGQGQDSGSTGTDGGGNPESDGGFDGGSTGSDAGTDGGSTGADGGSDSGYDGGDVDGGTDSGIDAGPNLFLNYPINGSTVCGSITVEADIPQDAGIAYVAFALDGITKSQDSTPPFTWAWDTTQDSNGNHLVRGTTTDGVGAQTVSTVSVTVSNGGNCDNWPRVKITSPALFANQTTVVSADATDDVGVSEVEFFVGSTSIGKDFTSPYTANWQTGTYSENQHQVRAVALDTASHSSSHRRPIVVDNTPPTVAFEGPYGNTANLGTTRTFSADAGDLNGVGSVSFVIAAVAPYSGTIGSCTASSPPFSCQLPVNPSSEGRTGELTVTAIDVVGNVSTLVEHWYCYCFSSCPSPTVNFSSPSNGATVTGTVALSANLSGFGMQVEFFVDGTSIGVVKSASGYFGTAQLNWNTTTYSKTSHTLGAIATDCAGTSSPTTTIQVTVQ